MIRNHFKFKFKSYSNSLLQCGVISFEMYLYMRNRKSHQAHILQTVSNKSFSLHSKTNHKYTPDRNLIHSGFLIYKPKITALRRHRSHKQNKNGRSFHNSISGPQPDHRHHLRHIDSTSLSSRFLHHLPACQPIPSPSSTKRQNHSHSHSQLPALSHRSSQRPSLTLGSPLSPSTFHRRPDLSGNQAPRH